MGIVRNLYVANAECGCYNEQQQLYYIKKQRVISCKDITEKKF